MSSVSLDSECIRGVCGDSHFRREGAQAIVVPSIRLIFFRASASAERH